ncbi:MAG: UDP-N-acetylmuramate--L-alanine ligase, partial [Flavobacteriales bacterium]|nr:UDP-N-acetylmuramate--L-alanine ligase [Flavobacteriales bacterium]
VGGIGMSGLARYFRRHGAQVAGYDRTPSELTAHLMGEGIPIQFNEDPGLIPHELRDAPSDEVLVVRTPAVPATSPLLVWWEQRGARILKRSEVLGLITRDRPTVAVAGTHGKTTVSTMLAHLTTVGGIKCNAFLGGIAVNYDTNVMLNDDAILNVVEADEYDRSFLQLDPAQAIVTAMDPDHLDIYGTPEAMFSAYDEFAARCKGLLLVHRTIAHHFSAHPNMVPYALDDTSGPHATNVRVENGRYVFDLNTEGHSLRDVQLGMPGRHNVENAVAASTIALRLGVAPEKLVDGLATFEGVARRFRTHIAGPEVVYIDDYAHHPRELEACIGSVREMHPNRRVTGVFQPHLFTRTRDLAPGFARALALLDELLLLDIYPAREEPIPGITAQWLLEQVPMDVKECCTREGLMERLATRDLDVLVTMGAG